MSRMNSWKLAALLSALIIIGLMSPVTTYATNLAGALDSPVQRDGVTLLTFTTDIAASWSPVTTTLYDGSSGSAAQSGAIGVGLSSSITTTVFGPASVSFYQKVSSVPTSNTLTFSDNGAIKSTISGSVPWQQKIFTLPTGTHTLVWKYTKKVTNTTTADAAWLDKVVVSQNAVLSVTGPGTGAVLLADSPANISWNAPPTAEKYVLYYSLNGTTWITIPDPNAPTYLPQIGNNFSNITYSWNVPVPPTGGNVTTAKIKVVAYNGLNAIVGTAISAAPFTIQTLKVTSPNGGEIVNPKANPTTIGYTMYGSNSAAASATLSFSTTGGTSWTAIGPPDIISAPILSVNTYTHSWTVPAQTALKTLCKVKVDIKNVSGTIIATDMSDANFSILPFYAISGVATMNAKPLSGVTMKLGGKDTGTTVTDINGKYIFTNLLPGTYTVSATKSEYAFTPAATNVTLTIANFTTANFTAMGSTGSAYTLSGTVTGATGTGVLMTLTGTTSGTVMTDNSGNYSFANLPAGFYTVTPSKTGYAFDHLSEARIISASTSTVNFTSSATSGATFSISGKAMLGTLGLPGVSIAMTGAANAAVITDALGNYTIKGLKSGPSYTYTLTPSASGYPFFTPATINKKISGANLAGVNFVATGPTFTISGHILSTNTSTIPKATVTLNSSPIKTAVTDANGFYQIGGVRNGSYTLTPSLVGASIAFYPSNALVTVNGGNVTQDFGAQIAYSISGTISYAGTKKGRIYIGLKDGGGGSTGHGTSIVAPGPFTIRGVPPGTYKLAARMDILGYGTRNADGPSGSNNSITVNNVNISGQNITLQNPASATTPPAPQGLMVFPGDSAAVIMWNGDYTNNKDLETAEAYRIYWDTDPGFGSSNPPITVPAYGQQIYVHSGLTDGIPYYYMVSAVTGTLESVKSSPTVTAVIGALEGNHSVSGTVTLQAPVAGSLSLNVGVYGDNGIYFTSIETLASSQSYTYTITGIPNGSYQAFAFLDLKGNGLLGVGDMSVGIDDTTKIPVTMNSADLTQDLVLPAANGLVRSGTNHMSDGTTDNYTLMFKAGKQKKLPVAVTLTSGPNVPVPMDIARESGGDPGKFSAYIGTGPFRPSAGDVYTYTVVYSDNTTETLTTPVTAVLDSFAQYPTVEPVPSDTVPTFEWSAPAAPPTPTYTYSIQVSQNTGGQMWNYPNSGVDIPSSQTSVRYNVDGNASQSSLTPATPYNWQITVNDATGSSATYQTSYTQGGPIFDISGTVSGLTPDGVTVNLKNGLVTVATTTTSNGGQYSFSNLAAGTYSVVASLATYTFSPSVGQPVTITDTDVVVDFTETAIPRHSISGQVTFNGIGFPGVLITCGTTTTTTNANGNYTISNLLSGSTYTISASKPNYTFSSPIGQFLPDAEITNVNFTTVAGTGHNISGNVNVIGFGGGGTLQGVLLTLDTAPTTTVVTDGGGNFSLTNIPDATYTLTPSFAGTNARFYSRQGGLAALPVTVDGADQTNQSFDARVTFTISGTVSYPSGSQTGRVYVSVGYNNGGSIGLGTSIADIGSSPTFTIRGVPPGNYTLNAWMDTSLETGPQETGAQIVSSPTGSISSVSITNTDVGGQTIMIADPAPASPGVPTNVKAFPADSAAFIMWEPTVDGSGKPYADRFNVYYDLASNPLTTSSPRLAQPIQVTDNHSGMAIVSGLTNTQAYHFAVTANLGGTESSLSSDATATIGATAGLNSISGTITFPAEADTYTMYAGAYSDTNGVFFTHIAGLSGTSTPYSVAGMPSGTYTPFAIIDMNNDSAIDIGDIGNANSSNNAFVTVSGGAVTGADQTLSAANAYPRLSTNHSKDRTGSESYSLRNISVIGNKKLPVKVSLTGPDILGPTDLDTAANGSSLFIDLGPVRPTKGDLYQFAITYADAATETPEAAVSDVLDSFALALTVTPVPNDGTPIFSWTAPASPPANFTNSLMIFQDMGGTVWEYPQNGAFTGTSVQYNADGKANPSSLAGGTSYGWMVSVADANNNTATMEAPFYTPGSSIFTISGLVSTGSGTPVDGVTMVLSSGATGTVTTSNGGKYAFTNLSPGSYTVTPSKYGYTFTPADRTSITISDTDVSGQDFTANVIPTYHLSGTVSGAIADGVTVNLSGDLVTSTTTSNGGHYSFLNLVPGTYSVVASVATYTFSPTSIPVTIVGSDVTNQDFTATAIPRYGISGQVTFGGIGFPGVTVTATGDTGGIATTDSNGNYMIANLLSGETYTITASKTGYTFSSPLNVPNLSGNVTADNFTATGTGYHITGIVNLNTSGGNNSLGLQGVTLTLGTSPLVSAVTDSNGFYDIANVPNGDYTLTPSLAGAETAFYPPYLQPITVNNADMNNVNFGANVGYTVSGTVSYPSGTHTGRVYVVLQYSGNMSGTTGLGTSIPWPSIVSSQTYTIHGVPPGSYSLVAYMDTSSPETGAINAASPLASTSPSFDVTNAIVSGQTVTLAEPSLSLPPLPPTNVQAARGDGTVLLQWNANKDANGNQLADHYTIYYTTGSTAVTKSSPNHITVQAGGDSDGHVFVTGLTNGTKYNFAVSSLLSSSESTTLSATASATPALITTANSVSGTITFPSAANGKSLYVILYNKTKGIFFQHIASATTPQAYTIYSVPTSTEPYTPIAVIDMNGDGAIDLGDINNTSGPNYNFVVVSGNKTGIDQTLSGANALPWLSTGHSKFSNGTEAYSLDNIFITGNVKLPVKTTITGAAQLPVPMDLYGGYLYVPIGQARPQPGDDYTFHVDYSDGTSEDLHAAVSAVLDSFVQTLTVTQTPSATVPTFSWSPPQQPHPLPADFSTYSIMVGDQAGGGWWNYPQDGVLTQTSVQYNADGNASPSTLQNGHHYYWSVSVIDSNGNKAEVEAPSTYNP